MKSTAKILTWLVACSNVIFVSGLLYGQYRFGNAEEPRLRSLADISYFVLLGLLTQLGLILSPIAIGRSVLFRIAILLSMIPFVYYFIIHDFLAIWMYMIPVSQFAIDGWKYNFSTNIASILAVATWALFYGYNILGLIFFSRRHASGNMSEGYS